MMIAAEVVKLIKEGVRPEELALRYSISVRTVYRYAKGHDGVNGRPRALTDEEANAAFEAWSKGEANMYELAAIYRVHVETIRNYLKERL